MIVLSRRDAQLIALANDCRVRMGTVKRPRFGIAQRSSTERELGTVCSGPEPALGERVVPRPMSLAQVDHSASPAILMVDDDLDLCCNMADILRDLGYRVDTAHEGHTALHLVERQAYDAALFDLRMPGMDGLTLCRIVVHLRPSTAVFLITGYPADVLPADAEAAGIRAILAKPLDVARLLSRIEGAIAD